MTQTSTIIRPRLVEVAIGPSGGAGRRFKDVLIRGSLDLANDSKPNKSEIKIYNISAADIEFIEQKNNTMQVFLGEGIAGRVFAGDISQRSVVTTIEPPNRITTIKAAEGRRQWLESNFIRAYGPGVMRAQVLADIVKAIGLPVGFISKRLKEINFATGWAFAGKARKALAQILAIDGARFSIQQGSLQILAKDEIEPGNAPLISPGTGLKKSPQRRKKGISVSCVLNLGLIPGRGFKVSSETITGDFKATKVKHDFDNRGIVWQSDVDGIPVRGRSFN